MKISFNTQELQTVFSKCAQHAKEDILFELDGASDNSRYVLTGTGMFSQYSGSIDYKLPEGEELAPEKFAIGKGCLATFANAAYFTEEITFDFVADEEGDVQRVDLTGKNVKTYVPLAAECPVKFSVKAENKVSLTLNTALFQSAIKETVFVTADANSAKAFKDTVALSIKNVDGKPHLHCCSTEGHVVAIADVMIENSGKTIDSLADTNKFYIVNSSCLQFVGIEDKTRLILSDNMVSIENGGVVTGLTLQEPKVYEVVCSRPVAIDGYDYAFQLKKVDLLKGLSFIPSGKLAKLELKDGTVNITQPNLGLDNGISLTPLAHQGTASLVFARDLLATAVTAMAQNSISFVGKQSDKMANLQGEDENAICVICMIDTRSAKSDK